MKDNKIFFSILLTLLLLFLNLGNANASNNETVDVETLRNGDVKFNLNADEVQEKDVYDEEGDFLGVIGAEPVNTEGLSGGIGNLGGTGNLGGISTLGQYTVKNGSTWRIYWNAIFTKQEFYIDISITNNKATITRVYGEDYSLLPPYTLVNIETKLTRRTQVSGLMARADQTMRVSSPWGGDIPLKIWGEVFGNTLYTGHN